MALGPTKATVPSRTVDHNVAVLGKSHLILKCAYNYPQTLIPWYVPIFFVKACLPPFPQKIHLMPLSKIGQSYNQIHNKKAENSGESLLRKIRVPPPPLSLSELKWNSFLCHIVKESIWQVKCKVLFYILNPLRYLPEHHLHHKKAMFLTKGYPLLTLESRLFNLWDRQKFISFLEGR